MFLRLITHPVTACVGIAAAAFLAVAAARANDWGYFNLWIAVCAMGLVGLIGITIQRRRGMWTDPSSKRAGGVVASERPGS